MGMADHGEAKVRRHALGNVLPGVAVIVTAIKAPVILEVEPLRLTRGSRDLVYALAELRALLRHELHPNPHVARLPGFTAVVRAVAAASGHGDDHAVAVRRMR